jgi:predicted HTH domain antitoxin
MSAEHGTNTFTIELPEDVLTKFAETPEAFARELRLAAAIDWYREGRVSQGKGAAIAGVSRVDFLDALFRAKVPASQVTVDELMEEVDRAVEANRGLQGHDTARLTNWSGK